VFNSDFNVLGSERPKVDGLERHWLFRHFGNPCLVRGGNRCRLPLAQLADWLFD